MTSLLNIKINNVLFLIFQSRSWRIEIEQKKVAGNDVICDGNANVVHPDDSQEIPEPKEDESSPTEMVDPVAYSTMTTTSAPMTPYLTADHHTSGLTATQGLPSPASSTSETSDYQRCTLCVCVCCVCVCVSKIGDAKDMFFGRCQILRQTAFS